MVSEIRPLRELDEDALRRLVSGYTSPAVFRVSREESDRHLVFALQRVSLPSPYHKRYDHICADVLGFYAHLPAHGFCFGAYEAEQCAGIALAEPERWNRSLWVWELHVAPAYQRRGIGRQLVEALAIKACQAGLRTLVCETQSTNVPAIDFYRSVGFRIEGIDLSYYSNADLSNGEVALFLKRAVAG